MKSISREAIQRMVESNGFGAGGGGMSSAQLAAILSAYAQQSWVEENFVSIEWFDQIFQVFDDSTKLDVNGELPVDQSKMNIKAMFGFWTDFYISALGNGGQVGASITLASLADVNVAGVQAGQVLTWKLDTSDSTYKWMADNPSSGVDMTTVWNALAASTNEQINASHLLTALTGYATENWVGQQGYITSSDSCAYATNAGTATYATSAGSAQSAGYASSIPQHSLWGQTFDGTQDVNGDIAMNNNSRIYNTTASGGSLYIGRSNDEGWVKLSDVCSRQGDSYWKIYSSGDATFANVYSNGAVTALSDEREKNIIEDFEIPMDFIAKAPIVSYEWKDKERRGDRQHIGSIAQYWLREMPELVPEVNDRYTMDYGRIALLSAIVDARHIVNLEDRVARLERRLINN